MWDRIREAIKSNGGTARFILIVMALIVAAVTAWRLLGGQRQACSQRWPGLSAARVMPPDTVRGNDIITMLKNVIVTMAGNIVAMVTASAADTVAGTGGTMLEKDVVFIARRSIAAMRRRRRCAAV